MKELRISKRLKTAADMVIAGNTAADIGTDHAYLPIYLIGSKRADYVYACDIRKEPLKRAQNHIRMYGMQDKIEVRLSDGLCALEKGEMDTIVICGMGGKLMQKILFEGMDRLTSGMQLILSPQSEIRNFRYFLDKAGIAVTDEEMVMEDNQYYWIMDCRYVNRTISNHTEVQLRYGQSLIDKKSQELKSYLNAEIKSAKILLDRLSKMKNGTEADKRISEIHTDLDMMYKALADIERRETDK